MAADADDLLEQRRAFGERIRTLRVQRGWSQEELAERTGADRKTINRLETGAVTTSLDRLFRLAKALDVRLADLFSVPGQ